VPSRRQILAGVGAVSGVGVAGCSSALPSATQGGEGDTVEIIVTNETAEVARIAVRVEQEDGEALFSRVYRLQPGNADESAGIERSPAVIRVFTPTGAAATWEYAPPSDLDCDGRDIGITLATESTVESWYGC
jgi:hypothetical protein